MSRGLSERQRRVLEFMRGKEYVETWQLVDLIYPETKPYRDYFKGKSYRWRLAKAFEGRSPPGEPMVPGDHKWWSLQRMMLLLEKRGLVRRRYPWQYFGSKKRRKVQWALPEMLTEDERDWPSPRRKSMGAKISD
jgi:hypothetical protein